MIYTVNLVIGLLVANLFSTAAMDIASGADIEAVAGGDLLLLATGSMETNASLLAAHVDALLVASATSGVSVPPALAETPVVLVNRSEQLPNVSSVVVDDHAGTVAATSHLLRLGHTRIAHIAGPHTVDTARRRRQGFLDAMATAGLAVPESYVVEASFDERTGHAAAAKLMQNDPAPTAIWRRPSPLRSARWPPSEQQAERSPKTFLRRVRRNRPGGVLGTAVDDDRNAPTRTGTAVRS